MAFKMEGLQGNGNSGKMARRSQLGGLAASIAFFKGFDGVCRLIRILFGSSHGPGLNIDLHILPFRQAETASSVLGHRVPPGQFYQVFVKTSWL